MIRIGSRGSRLALWQANFVKSELLSKAGQESEIVIIKTKGDRIQDLSFDKIEGKGFFTKELEEALLANEVDLAVHSMKDLPTVHPDGLILAGISQRADPRDVLIMHPEKVHPTKPNSPMENALIGTSSARRKAFLTHLYPTVELKDLRGNVPTRIQKLKDGNYDGIVLAKAGLDRLELELEGLVAIPLRPEEFVPAPAQGVLAYQCKEDRMDMRNIILKLHDEATHQSVKVEREVLHKMEGGCHIALGVHCNQDPMGNFHCSALYQEPGKTDIIRVSKSQSTTAMLAENILQEMLKLV